MGLRILMFSNIFTFSDTYWRQRNGAAMGAPPCPAWATMYFAPFEDDACDVFSDQIQFYRRYIDDVFGIWLRQPGDEATWNAFKELMNASKLEWDFTERARSVDFLDLTIRIGNDGLIQTSLYEKPLNLHAYLPPHSAHSPGVLRGLVNGMLYRFHTLCTDPQEKKENILKFYRRLITRGYKPNGLLPLFNDAITRMYQPPPAVPQPNPDANQRPIFFRIQYHPQDPPSATLQQIWRHELFKPPFSKALNEVTSSHRVGTIGISRMITCYSRPPNLENLVSSKRNVTFKNGPTVSSFFDND